MTTRQPVAVPAAGGIVPVTVESSCSVCSTSLEPFVSAVWDGCGTGLRTLEVRVEENHGEARRATLALPGTRIDIEQEAGKPIPRRVR